MVYVAYQQEKGATKKLIYYVDQSNVLVPDTTKFIFAAASSNKQATDAVDQGKAYGALMIPRINLFNPKGISLYTKENIPPSDKGDVEEMINNRIRELKMQHLSLDSRMLDSLKTNVYVDTTTPGEREGEVKKSDSNVLFGIGMAAGILMYMFIFIYGMQIMLSVIEEKNSKVVEIIVSSVKPFQLMMGKILGLASVGLLQFSIWILLTTTLSTLILGFVGAQMSPDQMMDATQAAVQQGGSVGMLGKLSQLPFGHVMFSFLFYFIGGYLLYGALFASVGSAVDSQTEAQQFTLPITIPLLISYMSLFIFVLNDPHGPISVWLSIIPFTSPIAMIGRIAFNPPLWQEILSMVLLVAGFIFTTWIAGRIYRVGILMHGSKVNFKVLAKWFMMKG
jgi:ABC-2 type transport system permease protein